MNGEEIREILRKVWPEWKITDRIGSGSFGVVYRAVREDLAGTSYAAVKVSKIPREEGEVEALHAEGLGEQQTWEYYRGVVKDFAAEIKLMASVRGYTNIVAIEDYRIYQPENEMVWYILIRMELLKPFVRYAAEKGGLREEEIIRLGTDLCSALEVCRQRNIIHRDIKPDNIFLNEDGCFKLGDFGVARTLERMTAGLSRKGTPNYMAPEIYRGTIRETDFASVARVDIYSLGMVLYWAANGCRLPFVTDQVIVSPEDKNNALVRRMKGESLPPPKLASEGLQRIILKACAFNPEDRYGTAEEMREDLLRLRNGGPRREKPVTGTKEPVSDTDETVGIAAPEQPASAPGGKKRSRLLAVPLAMILLAAVLLGIVIGRKGGKGGSGEPTESPAVRTEEPAPVLTEAPTEEPTAVPTEEPTTVPTEGPTADPEEDVRKMKDAYSAGQYDVALETALKLAERGNAEAQHTLGCMFFFGEGVEEDWAQALKYFFLAAEQEHPEARYNVGCMYLYGYWVEQSDEKAAQYFRLAADQGYLDAQFNLAYMYEYGIGVEQSMEEAIRYYSLAADKGSTKSLNALGALYYEGKGVEQSFEKAAEYFRAAADAGYATAQHNLGVLYEKGEGVEQSWKTAAMWMSLSADQGYVSAQTVLGNYYKNGTGVDQSYEQAAYWYGLAAAQGDEAAAQKLQDLYDQGLVSK